MEYTQSIDLIMDNESNPRIATEVPYILDYRMESRDTKYLFYVCHNTTTICLVPSPVMQSPDESRSGDIQSFQRNHVRNGRLFFTYPINVQNDRHSIGNDLYDAIFKHMPQTLLVRADDTEESITTICRTWVEQHKKILSAKDIGSLTCVLNRQSNVGVSESKHAIINGDFTRPNRVHHYVWRQQCNCDSLRFSGDTFVAIPTRGRPHWTIDVVKYVIHCGFVPVIFVELDDWESCWQTTSDATKDTISFQSLFRTLQDRGLLYVQVFNGKRNIGMKRRHMLYAARQSGARYFVQIDDSVDMNSLRKYFRVTSSSKTFEYSSMSLLDLLLAAESVFSLFVDVVALGVSRQSHPLYRCTNRTTSMSRGNPYKLVVMDIEKIPVDLWYSDIPIGEDLLFYHDLRSFGLTTLKLQCASFQTRQGIDRETKGVSQSDIKRVNIGDMVPMERLWPFVKHRSDVFDPNDDEVDLFITYDTSVFHPDVKLTGQTKYKDVYRKLYREWKSRHDKSNENVEYGILRAGSLYVGWLKKWKDSDQQIGDTANITVSDVERYMIHGRADMDRVESDARNKGVLHKLKRVFSTSPVVLWGFEYSSKLYRFGGTKGQVTEYKRPPDMDPYVFMDHNHFIKPISKGTVHNNDKRVSTLRTTDFDVQCVLSTRMSTNGVEQYIHYRNYNDPRYMEWDVYQEPTEDEIPQFKRIWDHIRSSINYDNIQCEAVSHINNVPSSWLPTLGEPIRKQYKIYGWRTSRRTRSMFYVRSHRGSQRKYKYEWLEREHLPFTLVREHQRTFREPFTPVSSKVVPLDSGEYHQIRWTNVDTSFVSVDKVDYYYLHLTQRKHH